MKNKIVILLAFLNFAFAYSQNAVTASNFLDALFQKQYAKARAMVDGEVKSQISEQVLAMVNAQFSGNLGSYQKSTYYKNEKADDFERIYMRSAFDKGFENIMVVLNSSGKVVGFFKAQKETTASRPQTPAAPFPYDQKEITVRNSVEGNMLAGTMTIPHNFNKKSPVVILISGSGAQNRDSEILGHKPFLILADHLARHGIAALRMDDRGIGKSEKGKDGPTSEDFAGDISSAADFLTKEGYQNIGLLGHSEGGMIAPVVSTNRKNIKFLVLLAAPGVSGKELLLKQTDDIGRVAGLSQDKLNKNADLNQKIYSFVMNYHGTFLKDEVKKIMIANLTEVPEDQREFLAEQQASLVSDPWFRHFLKSDPAEYFEKTKIPVLALNGSKDLQVNADQNLAAIQKALKKAGNKKFETVNMPGLNHLFQTAETGNPSEYENIEETISPTVLKKISDWILSLK